MHCAYLIYIHTHTHTYIYIYIYTYYIHVYLHIYNIYVFGEDLGIFIFENWSRFLDDCETLSKENKINPNDLLSILNSTHQFNLQWNIVKMSFLCWTF